MVGGDDTAVATIEPTLTTLAPGPGDLALQRNQLVHALVGDTEQFADVPHRDMSAGQLAGQLFGFVLRPASQFVSACVLPADRLASARPVTSSTAPTRSTRTRTCTLDIGTSSVTAMSSRAAFVTSDRRRTWVT